MGIDFSQNDWLIEATPIIDRLIWRGKSKVDFCDADWQDCKQNILLRIVRKIKLFDESKGSFSKWVYCIACSQVINFIRDKIKERTGKNIKFTFRQCRLLHEIDPVDPKTIIKDTPNLHYFFRSLNKKENTILRLRLKNMSIIDIAKRLKYKDRRGVYYILTNIQKKYKNSFNH